MTFDFSCSYFPNGEHSLGVNILQDIDGTIQKLRDQAVLSFCYFYDRLNLLII